LRDRYVRGLETQEDRLIAIEGALAETLARRRAAAANLNEKLAALDFESVSGKQTIVEQGVVATTFASGPDWCCGL
jgi:hypothetical protein